MALVSQHVVLVNKSHGKYTNGDTIALKKAELDEYQKKKEHASLVTLLYVDHPNGDRDLAPDADGKVVTIPAAKVRAVNAVKSAVHHLVRAEKLTHAEEIELGRKAQKLLEAAPPALVEDPDGVKAICEKIEGLLNGTVKLADIKVEKKKPAAA